MATARETIVLALQKTGMQPKGGPSPDSAMIAEGLSALRRLLREIFAGQGAAYIPVSVTGDFEVTTEYNFLRLQVAAEGELTIMLPNPDEVEIPDGMRLDVRDVALNATTYDINIDGNGSLIDGATADYVIDTSGDGVLLMYDAATGNWKAHGNITIDQDLPLPTEYDEGMACWLAVRWSGSRRFGQSLTDYEIGCAKDTERQLRARYGKVVPLIHEAGVANIGSSGRRAYDYGRRYRPW